MTLPHNPAITVIDLPEGAVMVRLNPVHSIIQWKEKAFEDRPYWDTKHIPPGNYKLICLGLQATEQEAREIVEAWHLNDKYETYYYKDYVIETEGYCEDAVQSLSTLIASNGWKNPVFVLQVNY